MSPIARRPGLTSSFEIRHTSEDFPASHPVSSGTLGLEWGDLLWAAITIGRPNVTYVFQHGGWTTARIFSGWSSRSWAKPPPMASIGPHRG